MVKKIGTAIAGLERETADYQSDALSTELTIHTVQFIRFWLYILFVKGKKWKH